MTPRAVVFDLGGVLVDWNPRYLYRRMFAEEREMEWFLAHVCTPAWNLELDGGASVHEAIAALQHRFPRHSAAIGAWWDRWPEMLRGTIPGSVELLADLDAGGVPLYAGTNWSAQTWPLAAQRFAFLERFRGILVSGRERVRKPHPEFWALLAARFALEPARTVFVDDHPANVDGAAAAGFDAIRFTDAGALRAALVARGLPLRPPGGAL